MIELISYSQDVPVSGDTSQAVNYLVFRLEGNTFRVRVGMDTIKDLVTAIEESPRPTEQKEKQSFRQEQEAEEEEEFYQDPPASLPYRVDEDEDNIPSL